jgi:hypothetical protein
MNPSAFAARAASRISSNVAPARPNAMFSAIETGNSSGSCSTSDT